MGHLQSASLQSLIICPAICAHLCVQEEDKALHKCQQEERKFERLSGGSLPDEQRPTGFCSSITVGSLLPFKTAIMKGSIVELLARRCGWLFAGTTLGHVAVW
jgi:hypothetical protein